MNENKNSENQNYLSGFDSVEQAPPKKEEGTFNPTPMFSGMNPVNPPAKAPEKPATVPTPTKESVATPEAKKESAPITAPQPTVQATSDTEKTAPTPATTPKAAEVVAPKVEPVPDSAPTATPSPAAATTPTPVVSEAVKEDTKPVKTESVKAEPPKVQVESAPKASAPQKSEPPVFIPSGTYSYSATNNAENKVAQPQKEVAPKANNVTTPTTPNPMPPITPNVPQKTDSKKPKKEKKNKKYGVGVVLLSTLLAALIGAGGGVFGVFYAQKALDADKTASVTSKEETQDNAPQNITNIEVDETVNSTVEAVAKKAGPSIVGIRTTAAVTNFFGGSSEATGEGSGIIYSADGYIITNYHVIESAVESSKSKVEVFLADDTETAIEATVVGYNIASDLAVVKVEKTGLSAVEFADSDKLKVGQYVVAIGNPGGLEFIGSVSYGVISGLNRSVAVGTGNAMSLIQTDAAINPGNSGGALVDITGKLIGVNSVKLVSTGYEGMGFAIPSNTVKEICNNIIDKQYEPTPYIGIEISQSYTAEQLIAFGYPAGAVVISVAPGGPADESQIQRGDIITEFNGTVINDYTELENAILQCKPGDSVTVKIFRAGRFYSSHINVAANNS